MDAKTFEKLLARIEAEEHETMGVKGFEYTEGKGNADRLTNFKTIAKELGISPFIVWYVYFRKHISSIVTFIKTGETKSTEPFESRIMDARNYLALLRGLYEEYKSGDLEEFERGLPGVSENDF